MYRFAILFLARAPAARTDSFIEVRGTASVPDLCKSALAAELNNKGSIGIGSALVGSTLKDCVAGLDSALIGSRLGDCADELGSILVGNRLEDYTVEDCRSNDSKLEEVVVANWTGF